MQGSKITLSPAERELFSNAEVILTKNSILQKTAHLLQTLQEQLYDEAPLFVKQTSSPKISRGENYLGLPYMVLDYPRIANGENIFFIRSFFWWGNFYSSTLQLAGMFKEEHRQKLINSYKQLAEQNYFIGIKTNPWLHHFEADNYKAVQSLSKEAFALLLEEMPHTKIAARWPLKEWDSAATNLIKSWKLLVEILPTGNR